MRPFVSLAACFCLALTLPPIQAADPEAHAPGEVKEPKIAAASQEGEQAIGRFQVPAGMKVELVAAEPLLANPVSFCLDEQGRIYVAETYRVGHGVEDNRGHGAWLDEDLAAQSIEDRLAYFQKHYKDKLADTTSYSDLVRLLEDPDGDGRYEKSTVFADGFNDTLDGVAAGVLARDGNVYLTNIPSLYLLRDTDGDSRADVRQVLHKGYGVRSAFMGHDLHGLTFGPDGKLYYSIGDRGFNITTEGRKLAYPDRGAVFRCNPDGSELELFALGLRNPQELAFDQYGNLFTGDNNSDAGDQARWVYVVEGGDTGWRMYYQYLNDRGPWNREKLWHPQWEGQPAYIVPPLAHIASGPSGLKYYPGVGLPEKYQDHFFLCDFRGGHQNSGILSIAVKPKGAGFEVAEKEQFFWSVLATDVDFGPDSSMYVLDWVEGWNGPGKGRVYRLVNPDPASQPLINQTKQLINTGMAQRPLEELAGLLAHADQRVRLAAQFELVARGEAATATLTGVAKDSPVLLARLHAIWGLGQIGRKTPAVLEPVAALLADPQDEVRCQAAKVLGDARYEPALEKLIALTEDDNARAQYFAALALGKLKRVEALQVIETVLRQNADKDPFLRHACVMALVGIDQGSTLKDSAADDSPAVRMGVLLAWRRSQSPAIAQFLDDREPRLVEEAARAIYDEPIAEAQGKLASLLSRPGLTPPTLQRVMGAVYRSGKSEDATALALFAARPDVSDPLRVEAMNLLLTWATPGGRDRLIGDWRPLENRPDELARDALRPALPVLLSAPDNVRRLAVQLAGRLGIREVTPVLFQLLADKDRPSGERAEALRAIAQLKDRRTVEAMQLGLADADPRVRAEGQRILARLKPDEALPLFEKVLAGDSRVEQQAALAALAEMNDPASEVLLAQWFDKLLSDQVPSDLELDVLTAAEQRGTPGLKDQRARYETVQPQDNPLAPYRAALAGGDADRGRKVFFERAEVYCVRCHKAAGQGGDVGPDLSRLGAEKDRRYLLESIVEPNKTIAKGFDSLTVVLDDGKTVSGVFKSEDDKILRLVTAEGKPVTVDKSTIESRVSARSPMPDGMVQKISKADLRDLIEYLSSLKGS